MSELEERIAPLLDVLLALASGDFSARADVTGVGDVVDAIAAGVNMLGEEVEAHDERLQAAVRRQTAQLEAQNSQLEALDAQRVRFFQGISHELRTPLTLILGPLEQELAERPDSEDLRLVDRNARRLLRLVNQLLDLQKLSAGRMVLELGPVDLVPFLRVSADYFRSAAASHEVHFASTVAEGELWVWAEPDALEKVVFNYLSNALKFTPPGGCVELGAERVDGRVRVWVRDSGKGIDPELQGSLFDAFVQAGAAVRPQHQGTGLGLALVHELTEAMGGEVGLESRLGEGSTFWCDLRPTEPPVAADVVVPHGAEAALLEAEPTPSVPLSTVPLPDDAATVLVVDDLADVRMLLTRSLARAGFRTRSAADGLEALEVLGREPVDLVLTDWMMPRCTGPELIAAVRADPALRGLPVVLLTARSEEESRLTGLGVGADAFLGKPFLDAELTTVVHNLVALKVREREVVALNRHLSENVLKRYLPPQVVEELAGDAEAVARPRALDVTVLFIDLVGSTELTEALEPEAVAELMSTFFTGITELAFAHGATVDKFVGDGCMLLFGALPELAPAEQAARAVACAAAVHTWMAQMAERTPLRTVRIGVHHGRAVVGSIGSELRSEFTALGRDVNLASRIEGVCPAGATLVSAAVRSLLPSGVTEPFGCHRLKGFGDVELHRLLDTST